MRGLRRGRGGSGRRRGGNGSRSCTSAHTARWLSRMLCLVQLLPVAMLFLQQACCDDLAGTPRQTLGLLFCNGSRVHSEVIYWRQVYADLEYISPIAPKTSRMQHQYITFDWDRAGMFNVLMVHENIPVIAHALGRTLVLPPETQLFHQDRGEGVGWKGVATKYEDLFDVDMLKRQRGLRVIGMEEFLEKEAVTGRLRDGRVPPSNSSRVREKALYDYLNETADERPTFGHSEHDRRDFYVALPGRWAPSDYRLKTLRRREQQRLAAFAGDRVPQFYDAPLRSAKHLHIPYWPPPFRILDHFYGKFFFADEDQQVYYRRFVRDNVRFADRFHCAADRMIQLIRADARRNNPQLAPQGEFYALHIRRGDKATDAGHVLTASEILDNLKRQDGSPLISSGSLVFIATDDPEGTCPTCIQKGKHCSEYAAEERPPGCPADPSWKAFEEAGWKLKFAKDYEPAGVFGGFHVKLHGVIEALVCGRAAAFAGSYYSTFSGYIHRLRGYHGLGEHNYFVDKDHVFDFQQQPLLGQGHSGWMREFPAGWLDLDAEQI